MAKERLIEEELHLLRLVRALVKIKDQRRRLEIIQLVEAAAADLSRVRIKPGS